MDRGRTRSIDILGRSVSQYGFLPDWGRLVADGPSFRGALCASYFLLVSLSENIEPSLTVLRVKTCGGANGSIPKKENPPVGRVPCRRDPGERSRLSFTHRA